MNGPLRKVSIVVAIMMAALLVNLTYTSVVRTEPLLEHPSNRRVIDAEYARERGAILVDNTPIALSERTDSSTVPFQRQYPEGETWAPVTGWFMRVQGTSGLERTYGSELAGTDSSQTFTRLADLLTGKRPAGADVSTTLDAKAQDAAMRALGDKQGAVVALDWSTGAVLAMASTPSYDPNLLATPDTEAAGQAWQQLVDAPGNPLRNKAVQEVYPPGSTFKLLTAAAAIEHGIGADTTVDAPDALPLPGSTHAITNSSNCGGTRIPLEQALATSCNTAFGKLGLDLGADTLRDMADRFGFDTEPTIDLPAVASRFPAEMDEPQTALSAIGQYEVAASPLQMAQVAAAIANDGTMMEPYLVDQVRTQDLQVLSRHQPTELGSPVSEATARQLQSMMRTVVSDGTGRQARIDGMSIGGKTGTAQSAPGRPPYAWFVGFADDPQVAVAVFVQSADVAPDDISGGRVAAPIFRAVVEALR